MTEFDSYSFEDSEGSDEDQGQDFVFEEFGTVYIRMIDQILTSDRTEVIYEALGSSEEMAEEAKEIFEGDEEVIFTHLDSERKTGERPYFSISGWRAPWEPRGYIPDWLPPKDPSLN
jgi:hypothetical protein